ncbi:tetratricopeptide repeat protein [Desulfurivibrio alkaliphilus]|uniref:Tetratricopeptide TPR_2 repeat protein n=1 Tax=Desulfurivibrio alkaliphilus (strain DSM 19089 / UNIQEM U267 / AHT2) TaxID=589865 RepID=D6Z2T6_DESAT|nr:tetratricopeptide repeat protein [Desulfurivibrio alkaliphilus]ADH85861.1 Tetratricopeptide TPR_2 repeat protein [Desulfurivibrio alkaliphilus AHT 2]
MGTTRLLSLATVLAAVLLLTGGCASRPAVPPEEPVKAAPAGPRYAAELEPYEEAVDLACAYFQFAWGKSAELGGRYDEARYAYQQALLCDRKAVHVMRRLAMLLLQQQEREQAIYWVRRIIAIDPTDLAARSLLAKLYTALDDPDRAAAVYQEILTLDPGNANAMLMLAVIYGSSDRRQEAREILEQLVADQPAYFLGHYYLARLYHDLGLIEQALGAYERALELNWSAPLAQELAAIYEAAGLYEDSLALLRRMVAKNPADERARSLLADLYLRLERVEEALAELTALRPYSRDVDRVDLTMARILLDEQRYEEAVVLLQGLLADEPRLDAVRSLLVLAYYRLGKIDLARNLLEEIRPGDYGYEEAVLMLARIYHGSGQPVAAEAVLERALADSQHRYLSFYVTLALLHIEWHDAGQGLAIFQRALQDLGPEPEVYFEYAVYLDRVGDSEGALAKMQEVIALDPHDPYALNYVGYTWADRGENLELAREYIEEAVRLKPDDGAIRDSLGWVYYRLGKYQRAMEELELAVQLLEDDPVIHDHLGDAYRRLGYVAEALAAYRRALALLPPNGDPELREQIELKIKELTAERNG